MKLKHLLLTAFLSAGLSAYAGNTITNIEQVTESVTLTDDVDYTITGQTPFATAGSVNITNKEHAVLIFEKIKPSKVISSYLGNVLIDGEPAKNSENCIVQMYGIGAIVFPYAKDFKPLTVYADKNYEGETCNNYTLGHAGGYMKTLNDATFNNRIRSFKLKRGYMVTFAIGTAGWGYSRCFIADKEDLEVATLPAILDTRISSYRLFHWYNVQKKGLASNAGYEANAALNTSWCYDWAQGNADRLPDQEWVPNHIYEDWPSSSAIGSVSQSCHSKNNNEPANSSDDHPQDVKTVLNNWENMMRTGLRLCSPATHDGGWGWHHEFMNEVDARGWRCDIVDFHGYWGTGTWNSLDWMIDQYGHGRPIWFSEWVWGSSWGNQGIFAECPDGRDSWSTKNQQKCYDGTKPILDRLNSNSRVERYAYWNGEATCSRIYQDGKLSILGKYYAEMNSGFAFNKSYQFVPKETPLEAPSNPEAEYDSRKKTVTLTWTDNNGDLSEKIVVQRKLSDETKWSDVATVEPKDKSDRSGAKYSYVDNVTTPGTYNYRVKVTTYKNTTFTTDAAVANIDPAQGTNTFQYGNLTLTSTEPLDVRFSQAFDATPAVFFGPMSNANSKLHPGNLLTGTSKTKFQYKILPWLTSDATELDKQEELPFMALPEGNYKNGDIDWEVATAKVNMKDTCQVVFNQPFPEGVTPIVLTEIRNHTLKTNPISVKIKDVTNTGFKCITMYEDKVGSLSSINQTVCYLAITPGIGFIDEENELIIAAGKGEDSQIYGTTYRLNNFMLNGDTLRFVDPLIFANLQTTNYEAATVLRRQSDNTETVDGVKYTIGTRIKRTVDTSRTTAPDGTKLNNTTMRDDLGWVVIAKSAEGASLPNAIEVIENGTLSEAPLRPYVVNRVIRVANATSFEVYNMAGVKVDANAAQAVGTYIVRSGNKSAKIVVK